MHYRKILFRSTVIHANIVYDRDGDEDQIWIQEIPNNSKRIVPLHDNFSVFICVEVSFVQGITT